MDTIKNLIASRKFWAAFIAVVMVVLSGVFKDFPDIGTYALEVAAILGAYVISTGLDPSGDITTVFTSQKFWGAVAGLTALLAKAFIPNLPFDESAIAAFIITMSTYIVGVGAAVPAQALLSMARKQGIGK